jgi:hypothetical protein
MNGALPVGSSPGLPCNFLVRKSGKPPQVNVRLGVFELQSLVEGITWARPSRILFRWHSCYTLFARLAAFNLWRSATSIDTVEECTYSGASFRVYRDRGPAPPRPFLLSAHSHQ